jgi:hypothetical protein
VPEGIQKDEWLDTVLNASLLYSSIWEVAKLPKTLLTYKTAWIRRNDKQKEKGGAIASTGKGAKKRIRSPSASGEAEVSRNKEPKPNNADAEIPADKIREWDTVGMENGDIWGFGRKLGKMVQDAGLALYDTFRQYNAKGEIA